MKDIPHSVAGFIRFLNLKSLRARTLESYLSWVKRIAKHHGVACASQLNQEQVLSFLHYVQQTKGYEDSMMHLRHSAQLFPKPRKSRKARNAP
jgi:hypothetical protein